jgi:hypothetical protein
VVLFILIGLGAILMYARFGKSVGGKVDVAGKRVGSLGHEQEVASEGSAPGGPAVGGAGTSVSGNANEPSASAQVLPEPVDRGADARREADTRNLVLLGIIVLAVGALMILAIAQRIQKEKKKARKRAG